MVRARENERQALQSFVKRAETGLVLKSYCVHLIGCETIMTWLFVLSRGEIPLVL